MPKATIWPAWAVDQLRADAVAGITSTQCAVTITQAGLPVTRLAVLGKAHRLGLSFRGALRAERKASAARAQPKPKPNPPPPIPSEREPDRWTVWSDRAPDQCQWIYGEASATARTCAATALDGRAWCADHHRRAYVGRHEPEPVR